MKVNNAGISGIMLEGDSALLLQNTVERYVANALQEHNDPEPEVNHHLRIMKRS